MTYSDSRLLRSFRDYAREVLAEMTRLSRANLPTWKKQPRLRALQQEARFAYTGCARVVLTPPSDVNGETGDYERRVKYAKPVLARGSRSYGGRSYGRNVMVRG